MDRWPPWPSNRGPGIQLNFRQTVELYLWLLGDIPYETRAANNKNFNAQPSDDMDLEPMKEWIGDSSLAVENKTPKQDPFISTGEFLPAIELTMAESQCREPTVKSKMTFREKIYNWTAGVLKKRGKQPDTKTIHTRAGAERASEWIVSEMTSSCSSTCQTKTAYEGTAESTLKASLECITCYIKTYLLTSEGSDQKRASSEPSVYDIEFPYTGIKEALLPCREPSAYITKYLDGYCAEGSLKSVVLKRASSCSAIDYSKPANGGIPAGYIPKKILLGSSISYTKPAEKTTLEDTDPKQVSWESSMLYTMEAGDKAEGSILQKEVLSKSTMQYIKPANFCIPDGTIQKKLLSVSNIYKNRPADEADGECSNPRLVSSECALCYSKSFECLAPKRVSSDSPTHITKPSVEADQEASNGTTSRQYSSDAAVAAADDFGVTSSENVRSQSLKSRRNTKRRRNLPRDNSQKKKGAMNCFWCYPR